MLGELTAFELSQVMVINPRAFSIKLSRVYQLLHSLFLDSPEKGFWFRAPNPAFNDNSPATMIKSGTIDPVIELLETMYSGNVVA